MKFDDATQRQITAADPTVSTWLSANAGSGKTRVLTDRVARLLLGGTSPQNILCLTYTKAAANEMQNRLFKRLGVWSMMGDTDLVCELDQLGVTNTHNPDSLAHARTLFARAIDTPGGLRIQTIHSFCASLLRRFPIEAGVSPVFREMDERSAKHLRARVLEMMATGDHSALIALLAQHHTSEGFDDIAVEVIKHRTLANTQTSKADIWQQFGLKPDFSTRDLLDEVFLGDEKALFNTVLPILAASDKPTDRKAAAALGPASTDTFGTADLERMFSVFLFGPKTKAPYGAKTNSFPTKGLRAANPEITQELHELMVRVELAREAYCQLVAAKKARVLYSFANAFTPLYESEKARRGWLDFDDLIIRARDLLSDPAVAQWVLFRLDGGLDHILVDEAQDTSPDQWKVIELLAQEFAAGQGARTETLRTIFVVGDFKQSIYSFQGADPRAFARMRQHFSTGLNAIQNGAFEQSLEHSFRSSPAILNLVDTVFRETGADGVGGQPNHLAFHQGMPGRVDLWGIVEKSDAPEEKKWCDPTDKLAENDHRIVLAENIAASIENMVKTGSIPDNSAGFRAIDYGDILVLVQRRSELFHQIIRACKLRNLPIAGADRLKVGGEIAVKDLQAILGFLTLPQDDLSLAAALRSPLFGLDEAALFGLAHGRGEHDLWGSLVTQKSAFPETFEILSDLRNQADFLGPYALLERVLTRHGGRARLLARLGPEAEDGIDALLTQAITYEAMETPSLTGFLIWMAADGVEIRRQSDTSGGRIRVMTTHGAKGLESPIVILPDTGDRRVPAPDQIILDDAAKPMWRTGVDMQPSTMKQALSLKKTAHDEEMSRLLYVALTRAEKWLIVCASGKIKDLGDSWYRRIEQGMAAAGADQSVTPTGAGMRLQHGVWQVAAPQNDAAPTPVKIELPHWAQVQAQAPEKAIPPLSPTALGGEKSLAAPALSVPGVTGAEHGVQLHLLLEHLPAHPQKMWPQLACQLIQGMTGNSDASNHQALLSEASALITNPDFSDIFSPDALAEVDFTAFLGGHNGTRMRGTIDRLLVLDGRVLIIDFKSNQAIPTDAADVPTGILRQMAAYLEAGEQIFPGHDIELAILWTACAKLMPLPHDIVRASLQ
ncbi:MAG: double-strand break repair helicase AddA [Paracoccaceae bacterium]